MDIKVNRRGSDSVEISADDRYYYVVSYAPVDNNWRAVRHTRGPVGSAIEIGKYTSAEAAVTAVKATLTEKADELSKALDNLQ